MSIFRCIFSRFFRFFDDIFRGAAKFFAKFREFRAQFDANFILVALL